MPPATINAMRPAPLTSDIRRRRQAAGRSWPSSAILSVSVGQPLPPVGWASRRIVRIQLRSALSCDHTNWLARLAVACGRSLRPPANGTGFATRSSTRHPRRCASTRDPPARGAEALTNGTIPVAARSCQLKNRLGGAPSVENERAVDVKGDSTGIVSVPLAKLSLAIPPPARALANDVRDAAELRQFALGDSGESGACGALPHGSSRSICPAAESQKEIVHAARLSASAARLPHHRAPPMASSKNSGPFCVVAIDPRITRHHPRNLLRPHDQAARHRCPCPSCQRRRCR